MLLRVVAVARVAAEQVVLVEQEEPVDIAVAPMLVAVLKELVVPVAE